MKYRRLGRSNLKVSAIGLGGGGIGHVWGPTTDKECIRTVERAIELGVNFFDVAPLYGDGKAEEILGQAGKPYRDELIYATKVMLSSGHLLAIERTVKSSLEASLKRLQTDYVDLLQIHNWVDVKHDLLRMRTTPGKIVSQSYVLEPRGLLEAFKNLKKEGKIRFLGFTGYGDFKAIKNLIETEEFDTIQLHYNILHQNTSGKKSLIRSELSSLPPVMPLAKDHDLGVIGIRPLAAGALTNAIDRPIERNLIFIPELAGDIKRAKNLSFLIKEEIQTLSQAALVFALMNENISTVVPGAKNVAEIEEAVLCVDKPPLTPVDIERLDELYRRDFNH